MVQGSQGSREARGARTFHEQRKAWPDVRKQHKVTGQGPGLAKRRPEDPEVEVVSSSLFSLLGLDTGEHSQDTFRLGLPCSHPACMIPAPQSSTYSNDELPLPQRQAPCCHVL